MDKINIKYTDNGYSYMVRVPENFDYFEVVRFSHKGNENIGEWIKYYNGKIIFDSYKYNIGSPESETFSYTEEEKQNLKETFILSMKNHIYNQELINYIALKFGIYDVEKVDNKVILSSNGDNSINILNKHNEEIIGNINIENNGIKIQVASKYYLSVLDNLKLYLENQTLENFKTK